MKKLKLFLSVLMATLLVNVTAQNVGNWTANNQPSPIGDWIGVGTSAPIGLLTISSEGNGNGNHVINARGYVPSGGLNVANGFLFQKYRGSKAAPTVVLNNDVTGYVTFAGYDGGDLQYSATIRAKVDGTPSAGAIPQRIVFETGTTGPNKSERLVIKSDGRIQIPDMAAPTGDTLNVAILDDGTLITAQIASGGGGGGGADTDWVESGDSLIAKANNFVAIGTAKQGGISQVRVIADTKVANGVYSSVNGTNIDTTVYAGFLGESYSTDINAINYGAIGLGTSGYLARGFYGYGDSAAVNNMGIVAGCGPNGATGSFNVGVYGFCDNTAADWAGYFAGDMDCTGFFFGISDRRIKKDVSNLSTGLDVVMKLRPVSYTYRKDVPMNLNTERMNYGFIAQEVEEILPALIKESYTPTQSTMVNDGNGNLTEEVSQERMKIKSLNYISLIPFITQATQEQQTLIEDQKATIAAQQQQLDEQKAEIAEIKAMLAAMNTNQEKQASPIKGEGHSLYQNRPNPFNGTTEIGFYLADGFSNARIAIYDLSGKFVRDFAVESAGYGKVLVDSGMLTPGTYSYSLMVDNEVVASKRMVLDR